MEFNCIKKTDSKMKKREYLFAFFLNFSLALSVAFIAPIEIFAVNTTDFQFSIRDFVKLLSLASVGYICVASIVMCVIPRAIRTICEWGIVSFFLCCYFQVMFMNGKMEVIRGQEIEWNLSLKVVNIVIWFVAFTVVGVIIWKNTKWTKILGYLVCFILVLQLVSFITTLVSTGALAESKTGYISDDHMLELGNKNNVIVFVLDFFDGRTMESILSEDEEFLYPLDGAVYYPNSTSVHSRTFPSITYLLTGQKFFFDIDTNQYVNEAFEKSEFIKKLNKRGINVGLYTYPEYIGSVAEKYMCNYNDGSHEMNTYPTLKYLAKMVLYRNAPYIIKNRFKYDPDLINSEAMVVAGDNRFQNFNDEWFLEKIRDDEVCISENYEKCFRFYHLRGCHGNLSDPVSEGKKAFKVVFEYCEHLKSLDLYKDSTIIVMTDHGYSGSGEHLDLPQETAAALMIVKTSGSADELIKTSNAPVSQTDFIPTVEKCFSIKNAAEAIYEINEDEERDRKYYYTALYSDEEGEVELREYSVKGDARIADSYVYTGNKWKVLYSKNKVAN